MIKSKKKSKTKKIVKRTKYLPATVINNGKIRKFAKGDCVYVPYADYMYTATVTKLVRNSAYVRFKENGYIARFSQAKMKRSNKVFIIESAGEKRMDRGFSEGRLLVEFLKMIGCEPEYCFIRTKKELIYFFRKAAKSVSSHIHLCTHGHKDAIVLVLDRVTVDELIELAGRLSGKVVFASTCLTGHKEFGQNFVSHTNCDAYLAPLNNISWPDAALISQLFYKRVFCGAVSTQSAYRFVRQYYPENAGLRMYTPENNFETE